MGIQDTCTNECAYCYATTSLNTAIRHSRNHVPNAPMLTGYPIGDEIITDRTTKSQKMESCMPNMTLRQLCDEDIPLVESWMRADHAKLWFENPEDWLFEIKSRDREFAFITHLIAETDSCPIGFCQYYDCYDGQKHEDWYSVSSPGVLFSIDYLIGNPEYLGQGYGKELVRLLTEIIRCIPTAKTIVVQPNAENAISRSVLVANGYVYDENSDAYLLNSTFAPRILKQKHCYYLIMRI